MYLGFCVRVLVLSLLTLGQHADAMSYRSGASTYVRPYFDYTNQKLPLASALESSTQSGRFLGSSRSNHGAGGPVDGYSPEGSVSSYGSSSLNIRKPTQNSKPPRQPNPNVDGVFQTKPGMWDLGSTQNGKRFEFVTASSKSVMQVSGQPPSIPEQLRYQLSSRPQQPAKPSVILRPSFLKPAYPSKPPQPAYPSKPSQPDKPSMPQKPRFQQQGYLSKPRQQIFRSKPRQLGDPSKPLQTGYRAMRPSLQQDDFTSKPHQVGIQDEAGIWDTLSARCS